MNNKLLGTSKVAVAAGGAAGTYQMVGGISTKPHLSTDGGSTFNEVTGLSAEFWRVNEMSATGQYMLMAGNATSYIYVSDDYGSTWTEVTTFGSIGHNRGAMSDSGQYMYITSNSTTATIYRSDDYGVTWSSESVAGGNTAQGITCDSTGQYVFTIVTDVTNVAESSDYGDTWSNGGNISGQLSADMASSDDATYILTVTTSEDAATVSSNGGSTFNAISIAEVPLSNQYDCSVSSTGQYMILVRYTDYIYTSDDYGVTWTKHTEMSALSYRGSAISSDGSQMWAVDFTNGDIHYSDDYGASFSSSDPSTGYNLLTISVNKE